MAPLQTAHVHNLVSGMLLLTLTFASCLVARNFPWGPGLKFGFLKLQGLGARSEPAVGCFSMTSTRNPPGEPLGLVPGGKGVSRTGGVPHSKPFLPGMALGPASPLQMGRSHRTSVTEAAPGCWECCWQNVSEWVL